VKNIISYIGGGDKNQASVHLHRKFGFQLIGIYKDIGYKFNDYHDMSSHQLIL
jgi:phosphinothricin acetyltransferase